MGAACFANVSVARLSFLDPRILTLTIMLSGALLLGALVLALVNRWRKKQANVIVSAHEQLAQFRAVHDRGELSDEEFERIRERLTKPLKPAAKPAPLPAAGQPAPPADNVAPAPERPKPLPDNGAPPPATDS